jgi:hypothetical protein
MKIQDPSIMAIPSSLRTILWAKNCDMAILRNRHFKKSKGADERKRRLMESFRHGGA